MILDGNKLEILMVNKGMNITTLCKVGKMCKKTIIAVRKGEDVSISTAIKLTKALDVPIEELIKEE